MKFRAFFVVILLVLNPLLSLAAELAVVTDIAAGAGMANDHCNDLAEIHEPQFTGATAELNHDAASQERHTDCADECGNCSACAAATSAATVWAVNEAPAAYIAAVYRAPPTGIATLLYRPPILS